MTDKLAALQPDVTLQPHQKRIADEAAVSPLRKLMLHALGSGKSLTSIAAAEAHGEPYTAIVPAALRANYQGEQARFSDGSLPSSVMSYSGLAAGKEVAHPRSLVLDEAHRVRNPHSASSQRAFDLARHANQVVLLTGTPMTNRPGDLAPLISMLKGERTTPEEFEQRFVRKKKVRPSVLQRLLYGATTGEEEEPANVDELKQMLEGHIDYHAPLNSVVPVGREDVHVEMGPEQSRLYHAMWKRLPLVTRWKLQRDFPLSSDELLKLRSFLSGPRQVSLSTYPYLRKQDPMRAFKQSPKLQAAYGKLQETLKDDRSKALVFSNFIDAGLVPYSAALQKNNIPHALFHGGLNDAARKKLVEDFNTNKLRVALLGPSGTEGLSFKGTQAVQLLDGHFHPVRGKQSEGRALRFDSHEGLPEELRQVNVQRFFSRLPPGMAERFKALIMRRSPRLREGTDDHLEALAKRKGKLNEKFMEILKEVGQPQA